MPPRALDPRITEHRNPRSANIDLASPIEIVDIMNAEDRGVPDAVATQREQIGRGIALIEHAFRHGGRLFYAGAGTSGRLGILDASECPPTFGSNPELVQGIIAGGLEAVFRAQEGAEDLPENGARAVEEHGVRAGDVIIGIAASGTTPFVRGALTKAKALGATTGIIACTPIDAPFAESLDVAIVPVTGPEVVTGSTRLKAGTATKLVLNMLTTGAMIRIGKTFGNLMIDLKVTNLKLVDRSERILMEVCDVSREEARALMEAAGGRVKLAIVMHALGGSAAEAEAALVAGDGVIRRVVGGEPPPVGG
ncbi:MAG: N-acetylmuramic acid 6-phosphate etherase [Gemmatimonadaceae bacterium]|nr:N-acetylmuramic acid 6-phosphate etherase [Gemmatimonadaceae bacterium]